MLDLSVHQTDKEEKESWEKPFQSEQHTKRMEVGKSTCIQ